MEEGTVYRSGVPRREALKALLMAAVLILPSLWVAVGNWPPTGFGAVLILGGIAFDVFIIWDIFLAPASEVRLDEDVAIMESSAKRDSVPLADLTYAKPDPAGRPELGWKTGKRRLNLRGQELQHLLDDLRRRNPSIKITGLKAS